MARRVCIMPKLPGHDRSGAAPLSTAWEPHVAFLLLLPAILSLLALCGHLLRQGLLLLLPLLFMLIPLLILRRGWVARLWQVVLFLGALEWIRWGIFLAKERQAHPQQAVELVQISVEVDPGRGFRHPATVA